MDLKILQLNVRGLTHKKNLIETYMEMEDIDIAMLSEIKLYNESVTNLKFNKYNIHASTRENGIIASGGVAFLVKKN